MVSRIFIASKEVALEKEHLYLVYDADGNLDTTNDQEVIRGGPENTPLPTGQIVVEAGRAIAASEDRYNGATPADRNFTELEGANADEVWIAMKAAADALGSDIGDDKRETVLDYYALGPNSNSTIATILYRTGHNVFDVLPHEGGDSPDPIRASIFTGLNGLLGTAGNDTWNITPENFTRIISDQGGDDTYVLDGDTLGNSNGVLTLNEIGELGGDNVLVIEGVDPGDVSIARSGSGGLVVMFDGKVVAWVPDQFGGPYPKLGHVEIVPESGPPVSIPVYDPEDVPFLQPREMPGWVEGLVDAWDDAPLASPLVLDLDGDGIELVAKNEVGSVHWDIDLDGFGESTGWTTGGDGLLAIDLNSDGIITDHSELFGAQAGSPNGFSALAAYDSNSSGTITSADTNFGNLRVWIDANADGYSQSAELHSLSGLGITSINLSYSNVNYTIAGNAIKQSSTFTIGGNSRTIVDAWFAYDNVNTVYSGDYDLDPRTAFLPSLRGYGKIPDLNIAMSLDEDLLEMVEEVAAADRDTIMSASFDIYGKMEAILYRWAGVDGVSPTSHGTQVDGRKLEFLQEFTDSIWTSGGSSPANGSARLINEAFVLALGQFAAQLLVQTDAKAIFDEDAHYDPITGEAENLDTGHFWSLADYSSLYRTDFTPTATDDIYLYQLGDGSRTVGEVGGGTDCILFGSDIQAGDIRIWNPTSSNLDIYIGSAKIRIESQFQDTAHNIEYALFSDGTKISLTTELAITGTASSETLSGFSDDNIMTGAGGNDTIRGYAGNDAYVWNLGDGTDTIIDSAGTADMVKLGAGIDLDDLRFFRNDTSLEIHIGASKITLDNQLYDLIYTGNSYDEIETLKFSDLSTLDLVHNLTFMGTSSADNLFGVNDGNTLYGMSGNDNVQGYGGDDVLYGGTGADTLYGGTGADTFAWQTADLASAPLDTIGDFSKSGGDKIDLSDVLSDAGYDPLTDLISSFVRFSEGSSNTTLYVDVTGTGTFGSTEDVAVLGSVTDILAGGNGSVSTEMELQALVSNGILIAA